MLARRPVALGAAGGLLAGTVGIAGEWAWTQVAFPLPWTGGILPEAIAARRRRRYGRRRVRRAARPGLRGELPRTSVARPLAVGATACSRLRRRRPGDRGQRTGERALVAVSRVRDGGVDATVRLDPDTGRDAAWVTATVVAGRRARTSTACARVGPGEYRTNEPIPVSGDWKALIRVHTGRQILGVPVRLPADEAIPVDAVELPAGQPREFTRDTQILQREQKAGVAGWLKIAGPLVVLLLAAGFASALAWGVGRVGRAADEPASRRAATARARTPRRARRGLELRRPPRRRPRARRRRRRCPPTGRGRSGGSVATVNGCGPASSTSSQRSGDGDRRVRLRARGEYGATAVCAQRLRRTSTNTRSSRSAFMNSVVRRVRRTRRRRGRRPPWRARRRPRSPSSRRSGATTCSPREPVAIANGSSPISRSTSATRRAPPTTSSQRRSSGGSMSTIRRSGRSSRSARLVGTCSMTALWLASSAQRVGVVGDDVRHRAALLRQRQRAAPSSGSSRAPA